MRIRPSAKLTVIALTALLGLVPVIWLIFSYDPNPAFAEAIQSADKIVIRNGGFDCCGNDVDGQDTLLELTDPKFIAQFNNNIVFQRRTTLVHRSQCGCCGYPGIDWYAGGERIVLTGMQHGSAVRWAGFSTDEHLTEESSAWLNRFLRLRGVPDQQAVPIRVKLDSRVGLGSYQ